MTCDLPRLRKALLIAMPAIAMLLISACSPIPKPGAWHMLGTVPGMDSVDRAVPLQDGRLLILSASSLQGNQVTKNQIYDPRHGSFTPAAPNPIPLEGATVTPLRDGRILVAGRGAGDQGTPGLVQAYLYLPATNRWISAGHMHTPRSAHVATLLQDGRVLVAGGQTDQEVLASAEIFDPRTRTWAVTGSMRLPRTQAAITTLADGRALIAGGFSNLPVQSFNGQFVGFPVYDAETWSPGTGRWSVSHALPNNVTFISLSDGRVMSAGGNYGFQSTGDTFVFDPRTDRWTAGGGLPSPLSGALTAGLGDGRVLVLPSQSLGFGRVASGNPVTFDPSNNFWAQATIYPANFSPADVVTVASGKTLVVGGGASLEQFNFEPGPPPKPSIAEFDPGGYPALPGSTGPLASRVLVRDLALAALGLLLLLVLRVALIRRRPEILA